MTGAGVEVFIIDSGIYLDHDEFEGRARCGYNVVAEEDCNDSLGHGTHTAGTVGGAHYGVAKDVTLTAVKVFSKSGRTTVSSIVSGLNYVASRKFFARWTPMVANLSLGGGASHALNDAVKNTVDAGVTVVVSAGNSGQDACSFSPASSSSAITVAASTDGDTRASFSNYGPCIDIFAPGSGIVSAGTSSPTSYTTKWGTSMAAPHVAGAAALYLERDPSTRPENVARQIKSDALRDVIVDPGPLSSNLLLSTAAFGNHGGAVCRTLLFECERDSDCCSRSCSGRGRCWLW